MTGEEVKKIRMKLGLTQERFAHLLNMTMQTVNRWENGNFKPSRLAAEKLENLTKKQESIN